MAVSAINYLPPFANSLIMHVLTNAEKLIPLRDAASLAESRRLAGMRMVTGTTSPSTRYERISVSPASCSIKSEYVIASHAFKPQYKCINYTPTWEQRKFVDFVEASGIRNKDNLQLESYSVSNDRGFVPQDEQFENGGTMRDADKTAYWIVEPGSFAYNPARINVGSIGYQSTRKNVIVSSLYEVFKTDRSCDDRFLWHWFKSSLFTKQIEMLQEGGVRLYFFFDKLQKSEIWMPNVDEQRIIGQQFDQLDSLITLHQRKRQWLKWLDEGGEGTHHDIDILVFKFADDMKISVLCGVHACMTKSLGHTGNRYAGKQQQRGMGVP